MLPVSYLRSIGSYDDSSRLAHIASEALGQLPGLDQPSRRGRVAVVKPNWVQESHELSPDVWEPVITHPALVAAVVAELARRMPAGSEIVVCDAPHTYAHFEAILARGQLHERLDAVRRDSTHMKISVLDLRREVWVRREEVVIARRPNPHDPRGYVRLDLSRDSLFYGFGGEKRYYGADYDCRVVNEHHCGEVQEYLLAGTPLVCDWFINLPKLKTHKKTGITCCLKNLVGINGDKNWLPHHTEGTPRRGGDEFPAEGLAQWVERHVKRAGRDLMRCTPKVGSWIYRKLRTTGKAVLGDSETSVRNGNWHGNDTCWRMALDLNRGLLYGNADGSWREADAPKPYLAIVDGIIGGEGNGPLCPDPVASGVVLFGTDPAVVDATAAQVMGFRPEELAIVREAFAAHRWPIGRGRIDGIQVDDDRVGHRLPLARIAPAVPGGFRPHFGWRNLHPATVSRGMAG